MAETFYPFVENGGSQDADTGRELVVANPARIAVYDDEAAAPRVVVVEPTDIRSYLEEITATVTRLAQEQGGRIPFTVIREVVENLIHAYFIEPTVSILDRGNTIRFSDQGPGIADKDRALQYGTTSATAEMKRYIRGVGSGLPYAQQWLEDKGGSLSVDDNIHNGCVVTISLVRGRGAQAGPHPAAPGQPQQAAPAVGIFGQAPAQPDYQSYPPQQQAAPQPWQQVQTAPWQQAPGAGPYPSYAPYQQPWSAPSQPWGQQATQQLQPAQPPAVSERGMMILEYLRTHETVGPRDLVAVHQLSESTWSRELARLEERGLVSKQGGQKRHLTMKGRAYLKL